MIKKIIKFIKRAKNYFSTDELLCIEYIEYNSIDKNRRRREDLEKTMMKGCAILQEIGVKYWIGRGTLLGLHRDKDFLPNDIDIDIDVYSDREIYKIIRKMPFDALYVTSTIESYMQFAFLDRETNVIFDIWFYHDRDGKLVNRNCFGQFWLPSEKIENLESMSFNGHEYPAPNPDWYCRYWYGENWRLPKKYGKDWTIEYRKDCKGFTYTGLTNVRELLYYKE